jgi:PleD family two-component response regulator
MDYINRADEALYVSKQTGRNKYTFLDYEEKGGSDEA